MIHIATIHAGKPVSSRLPAPSPARLLVLLALAVFTLAIFMPALRAEQNNNPSGYPLPRFASLRSEPINVRKGPGVRYEVAWVFVKPGLPVEIIQEFDTWRKIRDLDGQEGWVHQNLLSGRRTGYIAPWNPQAKVPIRARNTQDAKARAWLGSNYLVTIERCDGTACKVSATNTTAAGRRSYSGFVAQLQIWGVYPDEIFK